MSGARRAANSTSPEESIMADKNGKPVDDRLRSPDREDGHRANEDFGEHEMTAADREQASQLTDPERRREIRKKWSESVLPDLPPRPGFHRCWVSTTHPIDTPSRRHRFGYEFVKMDTVRNAGWSADVEAVKDGQFAGGVRWREMVAMEITMAGFVEYMREFHFDQPTEATRGILEGLDQMNEDARSKGGRITLDEGLEDMRRRMQQPPPRQFES
jgi:hypothetical protein